MVGATGTGKGLKVGSVVPGLVPQGPIEPRKWGLWCRGWCHRCRKGLESGVCGTMVGATGAGKGPKAVPLGRAYVAGTGCGR